MKIKAVKIVLFISMFLLLLYLVTSILKFKYDGGIYSLKIFYEQEENTIDVLFLGSSHSYSHIVCSDLYKDYGISSYNLGGGVQPFWNTYYYLKEALKTQKPKLIVIDIFTSYIYSDFIDNSFILDNNLGIKSYINRINSIMISADKSQWNYFFNPLYQYHNRYSSLTSEDFLHYKGYNKYIYWKGEILLYKPYTNINTNFMENTNKIKMYEKTEKYYRAIIELIKKYNIPLLLIKTPTFLNNDYQVFFNSAHEIALEYNVDFINFNDNYSDYNLDFSKDFADQWGHLNYIGAKKFTEYLGKYLKDHYDLPDRRGDPKYYYWEMDSKYNCKEIYNFELKQYTNFNEYIEKVKNADDYVIGITMLGNYKNNDTVVQSIVTNFNIDNVYSNNASYVIDNNKLIYSSLGSNQYLFYDEIGRYTDLVVDSGKKLSINRKNYIKETNGINILIYDKFTEKIVDNIYLEYKENSVNYIIER
ncbi:SGNH/GDSL hydrolase family protein [Brachyspira intermedia]|uniref:SGNH/GDSL hydrolase family protein n=1 Tax=Brachyspira intermedia TaxID=84377 RepID=UPI002610808B|nr:SGNH/GDSL hydrolase family protein [uncultured Brachyspira sp.]